MEEVIQCCDVKEVSELLKKDKNIQIIDVREIPEYQSARIANSKLVPLSGFDKTVNEIDKNRPAYLLCGVGKRAQRAAEYLAVNGFKKLYVIDGGIKAWIESGYPVECG